MANVKEPKEFTYNIDAYIGSLKESDTHDWTKSVLRIAWGENPTTLDIRNVNMAQKRIGKGISLNNEEADKLVDILLDCDYGSIPALEEALRRKKEFFTIQPKFDTHKDDSDKYIIDID